MRMQIKKIKETENPLHPNNIEEGFVRQGFFVEKPKVGEPFYVGWDWRTSKVQEIIDDKTFRTFNSIYEWEEI